MSESLATKALEDDAIQLAASNSLGDYYRLGRKITVRVSGNHRLCLTCIKDECCHVRRVNEWLLDNPTNEQGAAT